jgi:general secretion pathway protein G
MNASPKAARSTRGFTLLELLVVLLIIALLAGYVGPKSFGEIDSARIKTAMTQMRSLSGALDRFRLDTGRYPSSSDGLQALMVAPGGASNWRGPYLNNDLPLDPWGKPYVYRQPGSAGRDYDLLTLGADGKEGGSDENADILSR